MKLEDDRLNRFDLVDIYYGVSPKDGAILQIYKDRYWFIYKDKYLLYNKEGRPMCNEDERIVNTSNLNKYDDVKIIKIV